MIIVNALSVFSIANPLPPELIRAVTNDAPSNSNTMETVVDVGKPSELKRSSRNTSLMTTARYTHITFSKVKKLGSKIP